MQDVDYVKLRDECFAAIVAGKERLAVLGVTPTTIRLIGDLRTAGLEYRVVGVYSADERTSSIGDVPLQHLVRLTADSPDLIVVATDIDKEDLIQAALPYIRGIPRLILGGYGHFLFRDAVFECVLQGLLVPSLANGYAYTQVHLYECLRNAARLGLEGVVAEFGMFKGGTTMLLSRLIEALGKNWKVIGFDTFDGFPPKRSILDMYAHPDCVFRDLDHVRSYLGDRNVEVVVGDVVSTASRLTDEDLILTFLDTDNFSSASAALDVVVERTLVGGAIVFDHFTGVSRHLYTIGERFAGLRLLEDHRYLHLHGTGVFYRQR
jgi:O-methyltransferase